MLRGRSWSGLVFACVLGCEADPGASPGTTNAAESTGTLGSSSTGEGTTFQGAAACEASTDCEAGYCVAPYDPGAGTGAAGMGTASCVPECVPEAALERWCIDDVSCCDALACDSRDGFCVAASGTSEGTIGESWSTGSSSESSSGSSSGDTSSSSESTAAGSTSSGG
jgi:hypothetical protein